MACFSDSAPNNPSSVIDVSQVFIEEDTCGKHLYLKIKNSMRCKKMVCESENARVEVKT